MGALQIRARLLLGCDGAYSVVRESMSRLAMTDFTRKFIEHGYKELTIPATRDSKTGKPCFALADPEALHIWPRGDFMMIGLPNPDFTFTCTIFAPFHSFTDGHTGESVPGLLEVETSDQIQSYFSKFFPDAIPLMPGYVAEWKRNPACRLVSTRTSPWNVGSKLLLLGDAAHAMVPFYGQGMNSGLEDVLVFKETYEEELRTGRKTSDDTAESRWLALERAVPRFAKVRAPAGEAIVGLSARNYEEMRDHTASTMFLMRKKFEGLLNWAFPTTWVPLYKMVAFTRIPYDQVVEREAWQDRVLSTSAMVTIATLGV